MLSYFGTGRIGEPAAGSRQTVSTHHVVLPVNRFTRNTTWLSPPALVTEYSPPWINDARINPIARISAAFVSMLMFCPFHQEEGIRVGKLTRKGSPAQGLGGASSRRER